MHKFLKFFVYTSLTVHFLIVLIELCQITSISPPEYLKEYDLSNIRNGYLISVIKNVIKIILFYIIVLLIDYKRLEIIKEDQDIPEELKNLNNAIDNTENKWQWLISKLLIYRPIIVVYLYIISINLRRFNIILYALVPFLAYKILFKLYTKYKYYKIFIWPFFVAVSSGLYYLLEMKSSKSNIIENDVIPPIISNYLLQNKYEIMVFEINSEKHNVGVVGVFNMITIFIIGDIFNILSVKELTAVLFHEIGHVVNQSILFRMLVGRSVSILMYLLEFLMIIFNKKLLLRNSNDDNQNTYVNNLIMLFVLLSISISPYTNMINNFYSNIDEIYADKFSLMNYKKKYLISSLIKLTIKNQAYYDTSFMYNLMYFSHPSLKYRLELINKYNK